MDEKIYYKIVWIGPKKLSVAMMQWFDEGDYKLASKKEFEYEADANSHCRHLAETFNLDHDLDGLYGSILD